MYVLTKCQFEPNTHVCRRHVCLTKIKVTCLLFCRFLLYMKQKMQNDRHVFLTFVKDTCLLMKINRHVCLTFVNLRSKTHVCRFSFFVPPRDRSPHNLRLSELRRRGRVVSDASDPGGRKHRDTGRPEASLRLVTMLPAPRLGSNAAQAASRCFGPWGPEASLCRKARNIATPRN